MHLIERYATACGVKIGKPYINELFFPVPAEKYISFQPFSKYSSKNYEYWEEVIEIIKPALDKQNIKIVQIGGPNEQGFRHCINFSGQTKISHTAFIIKNALMHFGADSFASHIASGYNKKIMSLYSNNNINNVKPYWTNSDDMILLEPSRKQKPKYSAEENPKSINSIKPEKIAKSILTLLNLNDDIDYKTIFVGDKYGKLLIESLPSVILPPEMLPKVLLNIRYDYIDNITDNDYLCSLNNLNIRDCSIITNKPLKIENFITLKDKLKNIFYDITFNDIDFNFINKTKSLGFKIDFIFKKSLVSKDQEKILNKKKLDLIEYPELINIIENKNNPEIDFKTNIKYKSKKILFANNNAYISKAAYLENKPVALNNDLNLSQRLEDINDIKTLIEEDSEYCLFYK
jgi:hypothetical protein